MWRDAYLENRVLAADPIELVNMLYERALELVGAARRHVAAGEIASRAKAIAGVTAVISELEASLDHNAGGAISRSLAELYEYMRTRLTEANLGQRDYPLAEVEDLLRTLAEAWNGLRNAPAEAPAARDQWSGGFGAQAELACAGQGWSA